MTQRLISTAAEFTPNAWSPAAETFLQLTTGLSSVSVEVQTQLAAGAAWVNVATLHITNQPIVRLPQYPVLRLVMTGNKAGETVSVEGIEV